VVLRSLKSWSSTYNSDAVPTAAFDSLKEVC
jgi:hypothetical protein